MSKARKRREQQQRLVKQTVSPELAGLRDELELLKVKLEAQSAAAWAESGRGIIETPPVPEPPVIQGGGLTVVPSYSVEWFDERFYKVQTDTGTRYLESVTTILGIQRSYFLERLRGDVGNYEMDRRMDEAGRRGSRIHAAANVYGIGGVVLWNDPQRPAYSHEQIQAMKELYRGRVAVLWNQDEAAQIEKIVRWHKAIKPKVVTAEMSVYNLTDGYAGTLDLIVKIENGTYDVAGTDPLPLKSGYYIADYKSGKVLDGKERMQMAAYCMAAEQMMDLDIAGALIIHTGSTVKNGIPGLQTHLIGREELQSEYQAFRAAHILWKRENDNTKPRVQELPTRWTNNPLAEFED